LLSVSRTTVTSLSSLHEAEASCTRCPLYRNATQVVSGEGPVGAQLMMVGEQLSDQEDLAGRPFVGPAGQMLDVARCNGMRLVVTVHPSYLLRIENEETRATEYERLRADLRVCVAVLRAGVK
jgi:uracil-DNA glycosylase